MIQATKKRFAQFNQLRNEKSCESVFWDVVVLTAADESQKAAYEKQLSIKISHNILPTAADYIVVADPPGYKIGNGGSTLVVLKHLYEKFGDCFSSKRTIIIHAGGYSQRLPNASVMGKVFLAVPANDPHYQMLEVKLASYIDFPSKIQSGGVFVCCSDTFESYFDDDIEWKFPETGFTGLAHPSPLKIGATHGVYVLEGSVEGDGLKRKCRKFLHKPSLDIMRSMKGCVHEMKNEDGAKEMVLTDSSYFISPPAMIKLLNLYNEHLPLTCELDAYGDFLQSLGTDADSNYINNVSNVCRAEKDLLEVRRSVFERLTGTPLHVLLLASNNGKVRSKFFHFGTTEEYLNLLTENRELVEMLSIRPLSFCVGLPFKYVSNQSLLPEFSRFNVVNGLVGTMEPRTLVLPCIMCSLIYSDVVVGERSVIEFCTLRESVKVGSNCIVSHCSLSQRTTVPANTFMHTVAVCDSDSYCTVVFGIYDNLKKSSSKESALTNLSYMGRPLAEMWTDDVFADVNKADVTLWEAKLFQVCKSAKESAIEACRLLNSTRRDYGVTRSVIRLSMADILKLKNISRMLSYRDQLLACIEKARTDQSFLHQLGQVAT